MYLTKIDLIPQQRGIRQALGDCQQLHQMIMGLFESDRKSSGVIYRVREDRYALAIYLYSNRPANRERLLPGMHFSGERDLTPWLNAMQEGQIWRFDLLASPTKKVAQKNGKNSQRRILRTLEERCTWLTRKGEQNGFRLLSCQELEGSQLTGRHVPARGGRDVSGSISLSGNAPNYRCSAISKCSPGGNWSRKIVWTWNAAAELLIFTRNKILNFSAGKSAVLLLAREIFDFISV